jgi:serine/threonine protein kinase
MRASRVEPESQRTQLRKRLNLNTVDPLVNETIHERYKIEGKVGSGGMGNVYLALDCDEGRYVAVKMVGDEIQDRPDVRERYFLEAKAAMMINHENVIDIIDIGHIGNRAFLVMEFLEGADLKALISERANAGRTLVWEEVRHVIEKVCDALDAAHRQSIIHRDLKPENIFLVTNGELPHIKLIDFGLVKFSGESDRKLTKDMKVGTPTYVAPEQIWSEKYDHRADLYSLGVVIYEALAGMPPFTSKAPDEPTRMLQVLVKHREEKPKMLTETNPAIVLPKGVEEAIMKSLEKDPSMRYQSALEMKEAILGKASAPASSRIQAAPPSERPSSRMPPQPVREATTELSELDFEEAPAPSAKKSAPPAPPAPAPASQKMEIPDEVEELIDPDKLKYVPTERRGSGIGRVLRNITIAGLIGAAGYFAYEKRKEIADFFEPQRAETPSSSGQNPAPAPTQAPTTFHLRIIARSGEEEVRGASVYDITDGRRRPPYLGSTPLDVYIQRGERRILIAARGYADTTLVVSPESPTQTVRLHRPRQRPAVPQVEEPPVDDQQE